MDINKKDAEMMQSQDIRKARKRKVVNNNKLNHSDREMDEETEVAKKNRISMMINIRSLAFPDSKTQSKAGLSS
jgi:hypothetical protein